MVPALELGGGVPAVAAFALSALRSSSFDFTLVSLSQSSSEECSVRIADPRSLRRGVQVRQGEWNGAPFFHVGAHLSEFEFQRYQPRPALTRLLATCDIVQVVAGFPAWANAVVGLGKPVSLHCATLARLERRMRDSTGTGLLGQWRRMMTHVTDRMDLRALKSVDAIQPMNKGLEEYVREVNVGRDVDIRLAPPGIDADRFRPLDERAGEGYLLCVGRLDDPRKNVGMLVDVMAKLLPRRRLRLVLAGQAGPPQEFWDRAKAAGVDASIDVFVNVSPPELLSLYQRAAVFGLPSDEEGFGMVVLESMACGVPVVSTRSGGPDGIITDGEDGFLVNRNDSDAFADQVERLLESSELNHRIGRKARATVEARYSERAAAAAFHEVWSRLLESAVPGRCAA
ncbi:MAG TPA: glycosyltransferase [Usitatibacter sp.]